MRLMAGRRRLVWLAAVMVLPLTEIPLGSSAPATADPVISEFGIPTPFGGPRDIVSGPDGNLWFTEYTANQIGKLTPSGVLTEFAVPSSNVGVHGIVSGTLTVTSGLGCSGTFTKTRVSGTLTVIVQIEAVSSSRCFGPARQFSPPGRVRTLVRPAATDQRPTVRRR